MRFSVFRHGIGTHGEVSQAMTDAKLQALDELVQTQNFLHSSCKQLF